MADHKLFNNLVEADVSDEEIQELFHDLLFVYDNPFDEKISEAVTMRGCTYIDYPQQIAH